MYMIAECVDLVEYLLLVFTLNTVFTVECVKVIMLAALFLSLKGGS